MMTEIDPDTTVPSTFFIQIDGKETARVKILQSKTAADLRAILLLRNIELPPDAHFVDVNNCSVPVISETLVSIRELVTSTNYGDIIKLKTKICSATIERPKKTIIARIMPVIVFLLFRCVILTGSDFEEMVKKRVSALWMLDELSPPNDIPRRHTYQRTSVYLKEKITHVDNGMEVLMGREAEIAQGPTADINYQHVTMYSDWLTHKAEYKKDYDWYTNMKASHGHCAGSFNERVMHSNVMIKDTPDAIRKFSKSEFHDWPQKMKMKIDLENTLKAIRDDDGDDLTLITDGKISSNMYMVAWARDGNNAIHILTYVTIFQRTPGANCHFNQDYWSGQNDRIKNAKKYFLLTKIESNPVYKRFLLGIGEK